VYHFIPLLILTYLAGSVNFSILLFRLLGKEDPRSQFSQNPGVVNVHRQTGPLWAAVILLLDLFRAAFIAYLALRYLPLVYLPWCALCLLIGNRYPIFHGFHGGKGVANFLGFTLFAAPWSAAMAAVVWTIIYGITRQPFLGSFGMILVLSAGLAWRCAYHPLAITAIFIICVFIVFAHRANISRLLSAKKTP